MSRRDDLRQVRDLLYQELRQEKTTQELAGLPLVKKYLRTYGRWAYYEYDRDTGRVAKWALKKKAEELVGSILGSFRTPDGVKEAYPIQGNPLKPGVNCWYHLDDMNADPRLRTLYLTTCATYVQTRAEGNGSCPKQNRDAMGAAIAQETASAIGSFGHVQGNTVVSLPNP